MLPVIRSTLDLWRRHAWYLWGISAVLLAPLALIELAGVAPAIHLDTNDLDLAGAVGNLVLIVVFDLLTAEILAAAAERMVATEVRRAPMPTVREFLRTLPWISLVVATVVYEVAVAIGLLLLVVPGVFVFVAGSLYGPVIVVERCPPLRAGRRSRELVRGSFWRVTALLLLAFVVSQVLTVVTGFALAELPHRWSHVLGGYVVEVLLSPLLGVGVAVLYYALVARERERDAMTGAAGRETGPAEAGPGT
jgi:hypothetical protein